MQHKHAFFLCQEQKYRPDRQKEGILLFFCHRQTVINTGEASIRFHPDFIDIFKSREPEDIAFFPRADRQIFIPDQNVSILVAFRYMLDQF